MSREHGAAVGRSRVRIERRGAVLLVTLDRPERGNSLSLPVLAELWQGLAAFDLDADLRVAVVTGAGERSFCTGRDLDELRRNGPDDEAEQERHRPAGAPAEWLKLQIPDLKKPIIAAINGRASGGGWAIAQRCDLRLASEEAVFEVVEIRHGLPVGIFAAEMVRLIPPAIAMELVLLGLPIGARRAYEIGFVNAVVPRAELVPEALRWAEAIAEKSPSVVVADKALLLEALLPDRPALQTMAEELMREVRREGIRGLARASGRSER